jgi:soluble P-type ATPase
LYDAGINYKQAFTKKIKEENSAYFLAAAGVGTTDIEVLNYADIGISTKQS